ncbi:MAG: alpha-mannosidase, partial [Acidimicrobiales bacterium]
LGYDALVGFGGEGLVFREGQPIQGINPKHDSVCVAQAASGGESVELYVEAAANPYVPWGGITWPLLLPDYEGLPLYRLRRAELALFDVELESALYDLAVLVDLAAALGLDDPRSAEILVALDRVALAVDHDDVRSSLLAAKGSWAQLFAPREASLPATVQQGHQVPPARQAFDHLITAVGHAHIDTAWLWPVRETRRKCARTFATALDLMDLHEDFVFAASQAQQHAFVKEDHPQLFERMRAKVAAGQFEPVGSMWVEPDTNLPSGESLVRQLVYGKRFFMDTYGIETHDCWLPDAFGFSGNLPQILQAAGVRYFLSQKLSWNEIDRFPHHTFEWEGIDGSRVLAHFLPADTYNGELCAGEVLKAVAQFAEHGLSRRSMYTFGYGDGGGGPTKEMLERFRRLARLPLGARIELGTVSSFFEQVDLEARQDKPYPDELGGVATAHSSGEGGLPVWVGELYLEHHRAVQTTQARLKAGNRRCEELLREAELWSLAASPLPYPHQELDRLWRTVLLHQFHDIIPGSAINWVNAGAEVAHLEVREAAGELISRALSALARRVAPGRREILLFNPASHLRVALVELDLESGPGSDLEADNPGTHGWVARKSAGAQAKDAREPHTNARSASPVQLTPGGSVLFLAEVPGCGWTTYELCDGIPDSGPAPTTARADAGTGGTWLDNGLLSVHVDACGHLTSVLDHRLGRELLAEGRPGNVLQLHNDFPNDSDAWDVSLGTFDRAVELSEVDEVQVIEEGPLRSTVRVTRSFASSKLTQEISLVAGSPRVDIACEVDWHERHKFLKVAFPLDVHCASASYEIAFGHLSRPTHANTSWDVARFEVPAHRWADLSEPGFGVALLNDCKYGYDVRANVMRLSLLRGPTWPDPEADQGVHRFSYALMAHRGLAVDAMAVMDEAERFNMAVRALRFADGPAPAASLACELSLVDVEGAMVSALKRADAGDWPVLRIFEPCGGRARAVIRSELGKLGEAVPVDVLERPLGHEPFRADDSGAVHLRLRPFELSTLRLVERAEPAPAPRPKR